MSCPICERKTSPAFKPFCSKRCADVDLAKWLGGAYAIPSDDPDDLDDVIAQMEAQQDEPKPH